MKRVLLLYHIPGRSQTLLILFGVFRTPTMFGGGGSTSVRSIITKAYSFVQVQNQLPTYHAFQV